MIRKTLKHYSLQSDAQQNISCLEYLIVNPLQQQQELKKPYGTSTLKTQSLPKKTTQLCILVDFVPDKRQYLLLSADALCKIVD